MKFILVTLMGAWLALMASCRHEAPVADTWYSEVRSANRLVLASMTVSKMATVDDPDWADARGFRQSAEALLASLKIGDRVAAYSYDTHLRAYIDLSELTPDDVRVDEDNRRVTIVLPPVHTEVAGRDVELRENHYRVTGLRSTIDAGERARIKEKINTAVTAELASDDVLRERLAAKARTRACRYFESLLSGRGYTINVE